MHSLESQLIPSFHGFNFRLWVRRLQEFHQLVARILPAIRLRVRPHLLSFRHPSLPHGFCTAGDTLDWDRHIIDDLIFSIHQFSGLYKRVHCVEARLYWGQLYRFLVIYCITIRWMNKKFTAGKKDLLEYEIQEWKVFIDNSGDMSVAEVKIVFRR